MPKFIETGQSNYAVVTCDVPAETEIFACKELKQALFRVFGVGLSVVGESALLDKQPAIYIGETKATKARFSDVYASLAGDETVVAVESGDLYLFGKADCGGSAGTLYAVYSFLERFCGFQYFACDETYFPKRETLILSDEIFLRDAPAFRWRRYMAAETRKHPQFGAQLRINDPFIPNLPGGSAEPYFFGREMHNFFELAPPAQYAEQYPECFDLDAGQLCLTYEKTVDIVFENLIKLIDMHPESVFFVIGQNDTATPCNCERCRAAYETIYPSGVLVRFVNHIAVRIRNWKAEHCPDREIKLFTFAYYFTHRPPVKAENGIYIPIDDNLRLDPDVSVLFTTIDYCFYHSLTDKSCEYNKSFCENFDGWRAISGGRIQIWTYSANYAHYLVPFWNFSTLAESYRLFRDAGVESVIDLGACEGEHMAFAELHSYVHAKLLWNPEFDTAGLIEEFINGYYKVCAPAVRRFIELFERRLAQTDAERGYHLRLYHLPGILTQSIIGYYYGCPDMVGGGLHSDIEGNQELDAELIVRSCEIAAFMPMIQFSLNVWEIETGETGKHCMELIELREQFVEYIIELAKHASVSAEPIVRYMEYVFPEQGFETVCDQAMLGDKYMLAPVVEPGVTARMVQFPQGRWKDCRSGAEYQQGLYKIESHLGQPPVFERVE